MVINSPAYLGTLGHIWGHSSLFVFPKKRAATSFVCSIYRMATKIDSNTNQSYQQNPNYRPDTDADTATPKNS